jgi:ankyrin repeat protein
LSQHYAARSGHLSVCQLLISYGCDVNAMTTTGLATPLHRAAYMGHTDIVTLLLQHKADLLAADSDGITPLHKVCVQWLLIFCCKSLLQRFTGFKKFTTTGYVDYVKQTVASTYYLSLIIKLKKPLTLF